MSRTAYVLARLVIHDRAAYESYARSVPGTLEPYGGEVLVADDAPQVLDGRCELDRLVLIRFPDRDRALAWATSGPYRRLSAQREEAAVTTAVLVRGVPLPGADRDARPS